MRHALPKLTLGSLIVRHAGELPPGRWPVISRLRRGEDGPVWCGWLGEGGVVVFDCPLEFAPHALWFSSRQWGLLLPGGPYHTLCPWWSLQPMEFDRVGW